MWSSIDIFSNVEVQFFPIEKVDGLKVSADVMGNDCHKWYECLKVLTEVSAKGVSKGENSAAKNDESFEQALVPLAQGDS